MSRSTFVMFGGGLVAAAVAACSAVDKPAPPVASLGGSVAPNGTAAGGTLAATSTRQGGTPVSNGGTPNTSGEQVTGGSTNSNSGSSATGGHGGATTGGTATAGASSGGTSTGGKAAGGTTSNGTALGGRPNGVSSTGGTATGSRTTGGTSTGGTSIGGSASSSKAAGGTTTGGTTATGGTAATTAGATGSFLLAWEDNFDSFDSSLWQLMTHSWDGNLAQFSTSNTSVASGILSIKLTAEPSDTAKPYRGVEMRSTKTLTYGKISARIRFAKGPGVVSGLVAIYTPWPADNWNEIDIEHLGKTPTSTQLNCMVYTGAPTTPPVTTSVTPTQDPLVVSPGFDAETAFHQYDVEWTTAGVKFFLDGTIVRTWTKDIARMTLPQNILLTIWASNSADWAGAITSSSAPTSAEIDWIRVYDWKR